MSKQKKNTSMHHSFRTVMRGSTIYVKRLGKRNIKDDILEVKVDYCRFAKPQEKMIKNYEQEGDLSIEILTDNMEARIKDPRMDNITFYPYRYQDCVVIIDYEEQGLACNYIIAVNKDAIRKGMIMYQELERYNLKERNQELKELNNIK